jgi:ATP-binding cassette subfamily B protein
LDEVIGGWPEGFATLVGERGVTLSGGQKQRTCLARSFIRNAALLLIDDSLSALDAETEARILSELRSARKGRTTLLVSHRPTALRFADRVFVIEQGCLSERSQEASFESVRRRAENRGHEPAQAARREIEAVRS